MQKLNSDYWPSARWKLAIFGDTPLRWIEPSLPFVLIGSHHCCLGRIEGPRVPPVAYIACSFPDGIEVWPTCPIAFARWGEITPEQPLIVGKKRIHFLHQTHSLWDRLEQRTTKNTLSAQSLHASNDPGSTGRLQNTAGNHGDGKNAIRTSQHERRTVEGPVPAATRRPADVRRQITLNWDGQPRPKTLSRRVMILGKGHPSTIRLYGQSLANCDHAIVSYGGAVWLINLAPEPDADSDALVRRLRSTSQVIEVGDVKVGLGPAIEASPQDNVPSSPLESLFRRQTTRQINLKTNAESVEVLASCEPSDQHPQAESRSAAASPTRAVSGREHAPESLTSAVTDRLVRLDRMRSWHRRLLFGTAVVLALLLATSLIGWVLVEFVLPLLIFEENQATAGRFLSVWPAFF